jgi:hypothetical protein
MGSTVKLHAEKGARPALGRDIKVMKTRNVSTIMLPDSKSLTGQDGTQIISTISNVFLLNSSPIQIARGLALHFFSKMTIITM